MFSSYKARKEGGHADRLACRIDQEEEEEEENRSMSVVNVNGRTDGLRAFEPFVSSSA